MTSTHSESNLAGLRFLVTESTWGRVGGDCCHSSLQSRELQGFKGVDLPLLLPPMSHNGQGRKIHSTSLAFCHSPLHPRQHATRATATELASYHVTIDPFHQPPSIEETDGSYIKPAMKKNKNVYGHSLYTRILRSHLHAKCWGYKDKGYFFLKNFKT